MVGGDLLLPETAEEQLLVEQYFRRSGVLSTFYYWLGILAQPPASGLYASTNGTYLETSYNAADPYCQWASYHYKLAGQRGYDCVLAVAPYAFDYFTGRYDSSSDLVNTGMYISTANDKYG
jgi:hypothetical protein